MHPEHLRLAFTVYWENASPATEIFYSPNDFPDTLDGIYHIENLVMQLLQDNENVTPLKVIFIAKTRVELSPAELATFDWKIFLKSSAEA
jgi:hypothetical protein